MAADAQDAVEFMRQANDADAQNRAQGMEALRFRYGAQWPNYAIASRGLDRPQLTINETNTYIKKVCNAQRQQRPRGKASPVDSFADKKVAKIITGLGRHVEVNSDADNAYDTAFDFAATIGWGYWRVRADYVSEDSFNQDLYIDSINNPFCVSFDPNSKLPDGSDAERALITDLMRRDTFKKEYPGAALQGFSANGQSNSDPEWVTDQDIRLAEYFNVERKTAKLVMLSNGIALFEDRIPSAEVLNAAKLFVQGDRHSFKRVVKWCKQTAFEILEEKELPGRWIPIVPVYWTSVMIDGKRVLRGLVYDAMDPQRMVNFWQPLALDTPLPTPTGWTTMGEVKPGDELLDESGNPAQVVGMSPIHVHRACFKVEFDDGSHIVADGQHPWTVEERGKLVTAGIVWEDKIITTAELIPGKHYINVAKPLQLPKADLPLDPYFLGVWLGDGTTTAAQICAGDEDLQEIRDNLSDRGCNVGRIRKYGDKAAMFTVHDSSQQLINLGLFGNKHIPQIYLRSSEEQRRLLLQGLMDTDGWIHTKTRACGFTTTSDRLAEDFAELLRSLGIKATSWKRIARKAAFPGGYTAICADQIQFSFSCRPDEQVFRLRRKRDVQLTLRKVQPRRFKRHAIVAVTPVDSVPVKCVMVNTPTHLFLAGLGMVPTHNTSITESIALAPKAKWLIAEGQDEGHVNEFKNANLSASPVLHYKTTGLDGRDIPPPSRIQPEPPPTGAIEASFLASQNLSRVMGVFDPAVRGGAQHKSDKTLNAERSQSENTNFDGYDNLTRSIKHTWRLLLSYIPVVYDTQRVQRIIGEDGREEMVTLNQKTQGQDEQGQAIATVLNDVCTGTYDVVMQTGPGYDTKRQEGVASMLELLNTPLGEKIAVTGDDLIVREMDFNGAEMLADRLAAANPLAQVDEKSDVPPKAQMQIKALQQQLEQAGQQMQAMAQELKYKGQLEQMKQDAETKRELMRTTVKAHENEAWQQEEREQVQSVERTRMNESAANNQTKILVEEIKAHVALLLAKIDERSENKAREDAERSATQ
jgi:hypothetical protein